MKLWRFYFIAGLALFCVASLLLAVHVFYDIKLVENVRVYSGIWEGDLQFGYRSPGSSLPMTREPQALRFRPRTRPMKFGMAEHGVRLAPLYFWGGNKMSLFLMAGYGAILAGASYAAFRLTRRNSAQCVQCGYDLRGTPGDRCSECGHHIPAGARSAPSTRIPHKWVVNLVYVATAVLWCSFNRFYATGPGINWPQGYTYSTFLAHLCCPLIWVIAPLWLWAESNLASAIAVTLVTIAVWTIWFTIVCRTKLNRAPMNVHLTLAICWFCLGPYAVAIGVWMAMMLFT